MADEPTLEYLAGTIESRGVPLSRFIEPDLEHSLTSIACFGDERITNLLRPLRLLFRTPVAPVLPP